MWELGEMYNLTTILKIKEKDKIMKKLLILAALFTSTLFYSCSEETTTNIEIDSSGFVDSGTVYLSSFSSTTSPDYDDWVINDTEATVAEDFEGLSAALASLAESGRQISITFPNLTSFPDYAMVGATPDIYDEDEDDYFFPTEIDFTDYNTDVLFGVSAPQAEYIGDSAFIRCSNLTSISFPKATQIANDAFLYCSSIPAVTSEEFPLLTEVGGGAFSLCLALTTVNLPNLTEIGTAVFFNCQALKSVALESVETVGLWAFSGCQSLSELSIPNLTTISYGAFYCNSSLTEIDFADVTYVGKWAFYFCTGVESIDLPAATYIGEQSFYSCTGLTSLTLPAADQLAMGALYSCTSLEELSLPSITVLDSDALRNCTALSSLSMATETQLERIDANAFFDTNTTQIALILGADNESYVAENVLTVGSCTQEFASIELL